MPSYSGALNASLFPHVYRCRERSEPWEGMRVKEQALKFEGPAGGTCIAN